MRGAPKTPAYDLKTIPIVITVTSCVRMKCYLLDDSCLVRLANKNPSIKACLIVHFVNTSRSFTPKLTEDDDPKYFPIGQRLTYAKRSFDQRRIYAKKSIWTTTYLREKVKYRILISVSSRL